MKNIIAYTMIMVFGVFITFNTAIAGERVKVFELAESGQTFEFPVAAPSIVVQSTAIASSDAAKDEVGLR